MRLALQVEVVGQGSLMEPARAGRVAWVFEQDQQAGQSAKRDVETLLTGLVVCCSCSFSGTWLRDAAATRGYVARAAPRLAVRGRDPGPHGIRVSRQPAARLRRGPRMVRRQLAGLGAHVSRLAPSRPALACVLLFALSLFAPGGSGDGVRYLVGAHYYVWYPDNFANGYLRGALRPAQAPALGEYDSRSASIAEQHIALAASHAIDFFSLDWWPNRPAQNAAIESGFLRAANIDEIRFCIFYESKDLGRSADENDIVFDAATKDRFVSDLMTIARRYFGHPSYLRIDGRPTLVLYVTRQMRGLFPQAMREMRRAMAAEGYDPFVIGDEIFWAVVEAAEDPDAAARVTGEPQLSRIRLFDAITAYNLYVGSERHRGYGSASQLRGRQREALPPLPQRRRNPHRPRGDSRLQRPRRTASTRITSSFPAVGPPEASEGSFFTEAIERIGKPLADPRLHAILITSWNEWNEDTAIEPLSPAPPTVDDASGRHLLTQGYAYEGYGSAYIDIVRDLLLH